jgi:hypothetical protein
MKKSAAPRADTAEELVSLSTQMNKSAKNLFKLTNFSAMFTRDASDFCIPVTYQFENFPTT